jgi:hypothetical protein
LLCSLVVIRPHAQVYISAPTYAIVEQYVKATRPKGKANFCLDRYEGV